MSDVACNSPESVEQEEPHFLDDPDVSGAFDRMLEEFSQETDRGAVLIAADIAAAHLALLIESLAPPEFSKRRVREMLSYPGMLSTFAARADLSFLAGYIDKNAHSSIDILRRLRNKAAHSQSSFSLSEHREQLREMCELGPGAATGVNRFAVEFLMKNLIEVLLKRGVELEGQVGENLFPDTGVILDHLSSRPDALEKLEGRVPRIELAFGVWILLGLVAFQRKQAAAKRAEAQKL